MLERSSKRERRSQRHAVSLFVGTGNDGSVPFGRARDLSVTGVFLETEARPALESVHEVSLVWGDDTVECGARVIRHTDEGVGLAFIEPDGSFRNVVDDILRTSPAIEVAPGYR